MFHIEQPEFGLVTGDVLTYRCEGHELIYNKLRMSYKDDLFIYERNHNDSAWRTKKSNQKKPIDIDWNSTANHDIRSLAIQVKTPPLQKSSSVRHFQCLGISKEPDVIPSVNHTYIINVDNPVTLEFTKDLPEVSKLSHTVGDNVEFDCKFIGQPKPKLVWFREKLPLNNEHSTLQFKDNNGSISIARVLSSDAGYYTCELHNNRDPLIRRSFDLRVKGPPLSRLIITIIIIAVLLVLIMFILLIILVIKYFQMKRIVDQSIVQRLRPTEPEIDSQPPLNQLTKIPLPNNFATTQQIRIFLNYINEKKIPIIKDYFKELGRGKFGVVYQVNLPDVGLVAAKSLPETIRNAERHRDKRTKNKDVEENIEMLSNHEDQKKKAAEMLINEMKVMRKADKHVNIVALKKVAYPEAKFRFLFLSGAIQDVDSFYLMELCSNGSLESMLKRFIQSSSNTSHEKLSLYETLSKQLEPGMTVEQAHRDCLLTDNDLKLMAYQVACGIDYLNRKQIAHCDIAPRNVLVSSRFMMKICDFGLATWTTYKNYREKVAQNESVQLENNNNTIAIHSLTPELAKAHLRASNSEVQSNPNEQLLFNKLSIKCDVWSFGIFLWTLFLKCRIQPFHKLLVEMKNKSDGETFFNRLARVIHEGRVLEYIDYQSEIPRNIYAIIARECLVEEDNRPEMIRIRALLCHSKVLPKQAFQYYASEYNRYQEENATSDDVERFPEFQGVGDLPSFGHQNPIDDNDTSQNSRSHSDVIFRPTVNTDTAYLSQEPDTYLIPITKNQQVDDEMNNSVRTTTEPDVSQMDTKNQEPDGYLIPIIKNQQIDDEMNNSARKTTESDVPQMNTKNQVPFRRSPPTNRNEQNDSYL